MSDIQVGHGASYPSSKHGLTVNVSITDTDLFRDLLEYIVNIDCLYPDIGIEKAIIEIAAKYDYVLLDKGELTAEDNRAYLRENKV